MYKRFKIEIQTDYGLKKLSNSWSISNRYRYRISKLVDILIGWNYVKMNNKALVGSEHLETKITIFGPTVGVGFRF